MMKRINVNLISDTDGVVTIKQAKIIVPDDFKKPIWCRFVMESDTAFFFYDLYPFSDICPPNRTITIGKEYLAGMLITEE